MLDNALIEVTHEEAEAAIAELKTLRSLEPLERAKLNIYDAVVRGDKIIDLNLIVDKAMKSHEPFTTRTFFQIALGPVEAPEVVATKHTNRDWNNQSQVSGVKFSAGRWQYLAGKEDGSTVVEATATRPAIPVHLKDQVEPNDLILWEPTWRNETVIKRELPPDPAILRHLGGPMYAVIAAWDLTDVEARLLS